MASRGPQRSKSPRGSATPRSGSSQRTNAAKPRTQTARERSAAFRAAERRAEQRRRFMLRAGSVIGVLAIAGAIVAAVVLTRHHSAPPAATHDTATATLGGPMGPEGVPLEEGTPLAPLSTAAQGATVDGIQCQGNEQVVYHIHTHVTVYVNGQLRPIPAGIGIVKPVGQQSAHGRFYSASQCYYWLHVHAQDGIIHVEAPSSATYTLGQFFDIWNQPLTRTAVGPAHGKLTVFVDGTRFHGSPRNITLKSHEDVQIDVGQPVVPPKKINWGHTQL
jgi:hypothetical protein